MGQSTDAILAWGYCWDVDLSSVAFYATDGEYDDAYDWWHENVAEKAYGTDIECGTHCSGEYPMPYICLSSTYVRAWRGGHEDIPQRHFKVLHADVLAFQKKQLDDLLKEVGIEPPGEPGWFLCSNWG